MADRLDISNAGGLVGKGIVEMKRLYGLMVRGNHRTWSFHVEIDPKYLEEWRADGLVIEEIVNIIPKWYVDLGLPVGTWCFIQDILNLKNPFK